LKGFRPSRKYTEIGAETEEMDQSWNQWISWAKKYKDWYEEHNGKEDSPMFIRLTKGSRTDGVRGALCVVSLPLKMDI